MKFFQSIFLFFLPGFAYSIITSSILSIKLNYKVLSNFDDRYYLGNLSFSRNFDCLIRCLTNVNCTLVVIFSLKKKCNFYNKLAAFYLTQENSTILYAKFQNR